MRGLSLEELESVVALSRRRNFRAAARDLGVSPTVLSQRIAASESKLGVRLFNRTTRSVAPTLAGSQFVTEIEPALDAMAHAVDTINAHRARPAGRLRINSSVGAAKRILTSLIIAFSKEYPEIEIDLITEDRPIDIVAEGFDAGIRTGDTVPRDMIALRLEPDQTSSVVGTPGYLADTPAPRIPKDLLHHRCIRSRMPSGDIDPWEFFVEGQIQRIEVPGVLTLDDAGLMLEAALSGFGLAYLPDWWTSSARADGLLVKFLGEYIPAYSGLALYYPSRRHQSAALHALASFIGGNYRRAALTGQFDDRRVGR